MLPTNSSYANRSCNYRSMPIMEDYEEEWARLNEQELWEEENGI